MQICQCLSGKKAGLTRPLCQKISVLMPGTMPALIIKIVIPVNPAEPQTQKAVVIEAILGCTFPAKLPSDMAVPPPEFPQQGCVAGSCAGSDSRIRGPVAVAQQFETFRSR